MKALPNRLEEERRALRRRAVRQRLPLLRAIIVGVPFFVSPNLRLNMLALAVEF